MKKGVKQSEKDQKKPTGSADQEELTDKIFGKVGDISRNSGRHGRHPASSFPLDRHDGFPYVSPNGAGLGKY